MRKNTYKHRQTKRKRPCTMKFFKQYCFKHKIGKHANVQN